MASEIAVQKASAGRYASPLMHGRFQVMESETKVGEFYICDHFKRTDRAHEDWKMILRQPGQSKDARDRPDPLVFPSLEEASGYVDAVHSGKDVYRPKPAAAAPREKTSGPPKEKKPSMASMVRDLTAQGVPNQAIYDQVIKVFPQFRRTSVEWYQKKANG